MGDDKEEDPHQQQYDEWETKEQHHGTEVVPHLLGMYTYVLHDNKTASVLRQKEFERKTIRTTFIIHRSELGCALCSRDSA